MNIDFDNFNVTDIKTGYYYNSNDKQYICIVCGSVFEQGEVFQYGERFFAASKAIEIHIEKEHGDMFDTLLVSESKYISFTEKQKELLSLIHEGMSDNEIASKLELSPSTVRHQKFMFREKAKMAKMYLAVYELTMEKNRIDKDKLIPIHDGAIMVDDRYITTKEQSDKILSTAFESLSPLKLINFSAKEKKKIVILKKIMEQFEPGKQYPEKEVNEILKNIYSDYPTIRRYLIEYGFMERTNDCKLYWVKK